MRLNRKKTLNRYTRFPSTLVTDRIYAVRLIDSQVYNDNVQSTAAVLGFSSPTFGPDIMLPPSINAQLRQVVMKAHGSKKRKITDTEADDNAE